MDPQHDGRRIGLNFGAVNYRADVYLNGLHLGRHDGGYTPFSFDITPNVRYGSDNILTVRVVDPPNDGTHREVDGLRFMEIPAGKESWYVNFSGIWQDVTLVITDQSYIEEITVRPSAASRSIHAVVTMQSISSPDGTLTYRVMTLDGNRILAEEKRLTCVEEGASYAYMDMDLPQCELWSPDYPSLYLLRVILETADGGRDEYTVRFGIRDFELKDRFFHLNGTRIILKGLLHQQQYPKNLAYMESAEDIRALIRMLKNAGWNMLRIHIRPTTPEFLDICDEEGMLVMEEPAIGWIVESEDLRERATLECRDMVIRDRNHPSIVLWGILNESGVRGAPDIMGRTTMYWNRSDMGVQKIKPDLARTIRETDPSRIISDDSGAVTCNYYLPGSHKPVPYFDNHLYMSYPVSHTGFEIFHNLGMPEDFFRSHQFETFQIDHKIGGGSPEMLFFQSEFGCGGIPSWPSVIEKYEDGSGVTYRDEKVYSRIDSLLREHYNNVLSDVFPSYEAMLSETQHIQGASAQRMIEALRSNEQCAGYVFTQLHDNDYECNAGLLDPWFEPKASFQYTAAANRRVRIVLETWQRTIVSGGAISVKAWTVNESAHTGPAVFTLSVTGPDGVTLFEDTLRIELKQGIQNVYKARDITVEATGGTCIVTAHLIRDDHVLDSSEQKNFIIEMNRDPFDCAKLQVLPFEGRAKDWMLAHGIAADAEDPSMYVVEPFTNGQFQDKRLSGVLAAVKNDGCDALFLGLPLICLSDADEELQELRAKGKYVCWCSPTDLENELFDFDIEYYDSKPRFAGPYHYFSHHPVFNGLEPGHVLDDQFAAIMPLTSVRIENARTLGGSFGTPIGYHFKIRGCRQGLDLRYGADLAVIPYYRGRIIISTYRIVENLGLDPVADRLMWNLLRGVF